MTTESQLGVVATALKWISGAFAFMWVALPITSQTLFWFALAEFFAGLFADQLFGPGISSKRIARAIFDKLLIFSAVALSVQLNRALSFPVWINLGSVTAVAYIFLEAVRLKEIYRRADLWFPDGIIESVLNRSKVLSITDAAEIRALELKQRQEATALDLKQSARPPEKK